MEAVRERVRAAVQAMEFLADRVEENTARLDEQAHDAVAIAALADRVAALEADQAVSDESLLLAELTARLTNCEQLLGRLLAQVAPQRT